MVFQLYFITPVFSYLRLTPFTLALGAAANIADCSPSQTLFSLGCRHKKGDN